MRDGTSTGFTRSRFSFRLFPSSASVNGAIYCRCGRRARQTRTRSPRFRLRQTADRTRASRLIRPASPLQRKNPGNVGGCDDGMPRGKTGTALAMTTVDIRLPYTRTKPPPYHAALNWCIIVALPWRQSIPCLPFSQNRKAVETSNFLFSGNTAVDNSKCVKNLRSKCHQRKCFVLR